MHEGKVEKIQTQAIEFHTMKTLFFESKTEKFHLADFAMANHGI